MQKYRAASLILVICTVLTMLSSCNLIPGDVSAVAGDDNAKCGVVISEVCASNGGLNADGYGEYSDWIELYNSSSTDVSLLGFSLTDDMSDKTKFSFGDVTIRAGEYLLVRASGRDIHTGEVHTSFKISASGETVALFTPAGTRLSLMQVPEMPQDLTCGFADDGSVIIFAVPTPGAKNNKSQYVAPQESDSVITDTKDKLTVRINEYCTSDCVTLTDGQGDFAAWAEIYNYGTESVSLYGLYLSDNASNKKKWAFPDITLAVGEYRVVFLAGEERVYDGGELHASFTLNGSEDTLGIYNGVGTAIDELPVYELFSNLSYGYASNGLETVFFALATPGKENGKTGFDSIDSARKLSNKSIVINEVVAVRVADTSAYDGDFVELFNPTGEDVNLSDYSIGKKEDNTKAIPFPDVVLGGGEYRIVYFGDTTSYSTRKDVLTVALGLNRYSNELYIFNTDGVCVENMTTGRLFEGVSCGRASVDDASVVYFTKVTPKKANASESLSGAIPAPALSLPGGYVGSGTKIEINAASASDTVYYTLDGSTPTDKSLKYTGAITVTKTVTVRAIAYRAGHLPSDGVSASYVVGRVHDMAVICINADWDDLYSDDNGVFAEGNSFDSDDFSNDKYEDAFTELVAAAAKNANYFKDWEALIRFDYIDENGAQIFSLDAGAKAFGQYSRVKDQKSMSINFRDKYGLKEICYPFFGDDYVNVFSSLVLRNSGQDCYRAHIRDAFIAEAVRDEMDCDVMAYRPVVVYINGEYCGIYDLRERIDENYIADHTGADPENVDLMKGTSIVLEGDSVAYKELLNFVKNNDMSKDANYRKVCEMMEIDNFIDYWIIQMYFANTDEGNVKFYREKTDGAKWRWITYDFDWSLQSTGNFFTRSFAGTRGTFTLIKNLIKNAEFKDKFVKRFCYCFGTVFETSRLLAIYDSLVSDITAEMPYHIERWSYRWSDPNIVLRNLASSAKSLSAWEGHVETVRDYIEGRNEFLIKQFKAYFGISDSQFERYMNG